MPNGVAAVRRGGRILSIPLALAASLALSTAAADAAVRYASPGGGAGPSCPQATPCNIQIAVESAAAEDEVIIEPGTYVETNQIQATVNELNVHGAPGPAKPLIQTSAGNGFMLLGNAQRIADLRIEHTNFGAALFVTNNATAERMVVESTNGTACSGPYSGSILRDSLCVATGGGGVGVAATATDTISTGVVRDVTAVGTGNAGAGILVGAGAPTVPGSSVALDVRNTIALAGPLSTADVVLNATTGATANIDLQFSNYDTLSTTGTTTSDPVGSPTNQTALPQLTAEYRELDTSPTRNAGSADSLSGTLDADGAQRVQGTAIDIGAYEFAETAPPPPPSDTTAPQTTIDKGPKAKTRKRKATFTFSSSETGSTFACKLDRKAFSGCTSPQRYKRLKKGKHVFTVVATDAVGNADATPAAYRWKIKKRRKH